MSAPTEVKPYSSPVLQECSDLVASIGDSIDRMQARITELEAENAELTRKLSNARRAHQNTYAARRDAEGWPV